MPPKARIELFRVVTGGGELSMIAAVAVTEEERHWLLHNIARGFTDYLKVSWPPVWVELIFKSPPRTYPDVYSRLVKLSNLFPEFHDARCREALRSAGLVEIPLEQRRFIMAREVLSIAAASKHGRFMGLPELLVENLQECQDYFAGVLLAPDRLIVSYRSKGGDFRGFAESFLIPPSIAEIRWNDLILLEG